MKIKISFLMLAMVTLAGCGLIKSEISGPKLEEITKPQEEISSIKPRGIGVQAAEERIDRSNPNWMKQYCVNRVLEIGVFPSKYEKQRGPFISLNPIYLSNRHTRYENKITCNVDYYTWPVREEAFLNMGIDYTYSLPVWEKYYEALTNATSSRLKQDGWKELMNKDDVGVAPDYMMSFYNKTENLREYLDVFYRNDEEVVYELLIIDLAK